MYYIYIYLYVYVPKYAPSKMLATKKNRFVISAMFKSLKM